MNTRVWRWMVLVLLLGGILLIGDAARGQSAERAGLRPKLSQPALSLVGAIAAGEPHDLVVTCAGYNCGREHDLVYYDTAQDEYGWEHVRFVDAGTLQSTAEGIRISGFSRVGPLLYDTHHSQVYAFGERDECDSWGGNCYEQARVYILSHGEQRGFFTINDTFNTPNPVDKFYHIEGVAIKPQGTDLSGRTTFIVDGAPNGNLDVVHMQADGQDVQSVYRYSYRDSVCGENQCNWWSTQGNSLALDHQQDMLYLADNNGATGSVRAFRFTGSVEYEVSPIAVAEEALCWVFLQSVTVAQGRNALYAPSGCQSFEHGSTVRVDTETGEKHRITYRYGDQGVVAVDPHDPRRVFITTSDAAGDYDSEQWLTLHMLYDDVVVASLPLLQGFGLDDKSLLRDMVFDPVSARLFISVGQSILAVNVGGVPPAEFWPPPVTASVPPDHSALLEATDHSATFTFYSGAVEQTSVVTYAEGPPRMGRQALAAETTLRPIREFELTGVISGTSTDLDRFRQIVSVRMETTARERAGVILDTVSLYWWDGSAWVKQSGTIDPMYPDVFDGGTTHTGRFALMGQSWSVYLPLVKRQ